MWKVFASEASFKPQNWLSKFRDSQAGNEHHWAIESGHRASGRVRIWTRFMEFQSRCPFKFTKLLHERLYPVLSNHSRDNWKQVPYLIEERLPRSPTLGHLAPDFLATPDPPGMMCLTTHLSVKMGIVPGSFLGHLEWLIHHTSFPCGRAIFFFFFTPTVL